MALYVTVAHAGLPWPQPICTMDVTFKACSMLWLLTRQTVYAAVPVHADRPATALVATCTGLNWSGRRCLQCSDSLIVVCRGCTVYFSMQGLRGPPPPFSHPRLWTSIDTWQSKCDRPCVVLQLTLVPYMCSDPCVYSAWLPDCEPHVNRTSVPGGCLVAPRIKAKQAQQLNNLSPRSCQLWFAPLARVKRKAFPLQQSVDFIHRERRK